MVLDFFLYQSALHTALQFPVGILYQRFHLHLL